jgi:2-haloacid dehalogenase
LSEIIVTDGLDDSGARRLGFVAERWATFDCYGTLVDWMSGIRATFERLWPEADADELVGRYHSIERRVQAGSGISYRRIMQKGLSGVAAADGLTIPLGEEDALGASLSSWPVFVEVPDALATLRAEGWKLAILSNTDADLLEASLGEIGVPVDHRVVASTIGSYKPAFGHWETFFRETKADRARHVHVAASLFHDIEPCAALGLPAVWINRLRESSDVPRAAELPDLTDLPRSAAALVPV